MLRSRFLCSLAYVCALLTPLLTMSCASPEGAETEFALGPPNTAPAFPGQTDAPAPQSQSAPSRLPVLAVRKVISWRPEAPVALF